MPDEDEIVDREVEIQLGDWLDIKKEAELADNCEGVREHAGEILSDYNNDQLVHAEEIEGENT